MGRFVLLASATLFIGLPVSESAKIGWPIIGYLMLVLDLSFYRKKNRSNVLLAGLFSQVIGWTFSGQWLMATIMLVLYILHEQSLRKNFMQLDLRGVKRSFPWPHLSHWNQIEFVVLKDGLLTIEYKNGRVLQQLIEKDPALSEANFNEFCQQQCNP